MGDFVADTALEKIGDGRYGVTLEPSWMTWGPAGGYVASLALRAAGESTSFVRPASFTCQFLSVARFEPVEITVETRRGGRRTEAMHVAMSQSGKHVLDAQVWAADENEGLEHDYTRAPDVPHHDALREIREIEPDRPQLGLFQNFERKPVGWRTGDDLQPQEPVAQGWYRFLPNERADDRFVDAARSVILIDLYSWAATWPAHPSREPSPWIAPNLDLHVRFHHDARAEPWLLCESRAEIASHGLIGTNGTIWRPDGRLVAAGSSQLFCRPRPQRFR